METIQCIRLVLSSYFYIRKLSVKVLQSSSVNTIEYKVHLINYSNKNINDTVINLSLRVVWHAL